jgi:hypothetical protein
MAVPISNVVRRIVFAPSGTGPYAFTFEILAATDIEVYKGDTLLTLTTDYTVTINPNGTGEVTLVATAGTDNITVVGARAIQRSTDFVTGGDFFANSLNTELDSLTIFTQQNAEAVARSLTAPVTDPTTIDMTLPRAADRANKYLAFDANGDPRPGDTAVDVGVVAGIENDIVVVSNIAANVTTVANNDANVTTVAGISGNVTTVANINANVTTVAGNTTNINTVATDLSGSDTIGTVAGSIADINALGPIAADIATVAGIDSDVTAVAADATDIGTVAGSIVDVNAVAAIAADVASVAADAADIGTVAGGIANVTTVAGSIASVNTAASNISAITTVASDLNEPVSEIETVAGSIANIDALGPKAADISTVAGIAANVTTVAGISSNVTTVAGISSNVSTVAGISAAVTTVAADGTDIGVVAGISSDVTTVAGIAADVTAVAGVNTADLAAVAAIDTDVGTVAGIAADVTAVAAIDSDVTAVAADATDIGIVATDIADVSTVAGIAADVSTVAGISADVTTVAADGADIGAVAAIDSDVTTVAGIAANVTTVATNVASVNTNATNIANINQNAANIVAIQNASTNATNAASSATAAAGSATAAAASAAAANAVSLGNEPVAPSIRPSLNLDFANTRALDPRITFTRTTTATYYDGKTTAKAEENLLLRSQEFDDAGWINIASTDTANTAVAPDGTTTADTITETTADSTHRISQTVSLLATNYVFSVFLKKGTGATAPDWIQLGMTGGNSAYVNFDLTNGVVGNSGFGGTGSIVSVGSGWYRCIVTFTVSSASNVTPSIVFTNNDNSAGRFPSYVGLTTSDVFAWGAQLEQRSAVTDYTPTTTQPITNYIPALQTAASGVARFDHRPLTGESLGLLVEEQRTNVLLRSEEFSNATWGKTRLSVTADSIVAPNGTLTGDQLVENTDNDTHLIDQGSLSFTSGTSYTVSVYAKDNGRFLQLTFGTGAFSSAPFANFNLSTGVVSASGGSGTATITAVGNGWYRCTLTATASATATASFFMLLSNSGTSARFVTGYTGDGYKGVFLWGAQLEAGAFPTSYIPTVAATVTRNSDAASMTGTNFSSWYRADEGTLYMELAWPTVTITSNGGAATISDGTTNNRIGINRSGSGATPQFGVTTNGVGQAGPFSGNASVNVFFKIAGVYKKDYFNLALNGTLGTSDTSGTIPVVDRMFFGDGAGGVATRYMKRLAYYPAVLADAQLQALTAS